MPPDDESPPLTAPPDEPKNILVAVDASAGFARVLDMAGRMTRAMPEAVLHVLHVFKASRFDRARAGAPTIDSNAVEEAKDHLAHCVRTLRRRTRSQVVQHFAIGDPAAEVLRLAIDFDVDLLVVGTHDYSGFERFLLGSVAETLMRKIGCPILVVRPKHHKG
jgi:nucleotide-binding universal stress UspA family protein